MDRFCITKDRVNAYGRIEWAVYDDHQKCIVERGFTDKKSALAVATAKNQEATQ